MNRKAKILLFILLLMALGFFRENLFVNINDVLYSKLYNEPNPIIWYLSFFNNVSYNTVYIAKWFITPFFAFLFWFVQKELLLVFFNEKKIITWLSVLYLSLFLLAGISLCTGWLLGHFSEGYRFSRIFMGLLESPVPCMILIPLAYFYKNYSSNI